MQRYLFHILISIVLVASAIASFNYWIDPYAIYQHPALSSEQSRQLVVMNERVFKTVRLAHSKADVVILGTSRADLGIGPEHDTFKGKHVINLATFGQSIGESRRLMEIAIKDSQPKTILLGLDFLRLMRYYPRLGIM